jgi:methyl-accepting chemotaxis protein
MAVATRSGIAATLEQAERELELLVRDSEHEVEGVAGDFGGLARETDGILSLAAAIVGCVETESILAVLDRVESMGGVARQFLEERLKATAGILETVVAEAKLLVRLSELTGAQRAIARETQTLSVLTNIEVARLGELGIGFQYLAHQLDDFSQSVAKGTRELSSHTEERRSAIEETRRMLVVELPHIRENLARTETRLGNALGVVNARLTELSRTPEQFRGCVAEIAGRIAGVVAAVQVQDITRQRVEHVGESLGLIRSLVSGLEDGETEEACGLPPIVAGLAIQGYQLRSVGETVGEWVSRIRSCIDGILRISCSEVVGIGPAVLLEVRELLEKLGGIEALEGESQAVNGEVESTLGGLSNLMQLVGEHLARSTEVRDRLRLITFNSIIEASHLGSEADAILEISQSIKRLAGVWSEITDRSGRAMEEILRLVEQVEGGMTHFSEEGSNDLRQAQAETRAGLESIGRAADAAGRQAQEIEAATGSLKGRIAAIGVRAERLDGCFARIARVEKQIEELKRQFESEGPGFSGRWDEAEVEKLFAAGYTTEIEREVLRAALRGEPLPSQQLSLAGNDVELF